MTAYRVTGTVSPDCTTPNTGESAGSYNGQNYYTWTNDAGTWVLWYKYLAMPPTHRWYISQVLGETVNYWRKQSVSNVIPGTYTPLGIMSGNPVVAEILASDNTPDSFDFTDVTDAEPSTLTESDQQSIQNCDAGTAISITGGEYQLAGGTWTSSSGVTSGSPQTIKVRATSSSEFEGVVTVSVTVGTLTVDWTVTTRAARSWKFDVMASFSVIEKL